MSRGHFFDEMKYLPLVCFVSFGLCPLAAQEVPQYQLFGGVSYLRVHASGSEVDQLTGLPDTQIAPHNFNFNLYGWDTSFSENLKHWFGGELDFSGLYGTPGATFLYPASQLVSPSPSSTATVPIVTREYTYLFGPRFLWAHGPLLFYVHGLAGAASIRTSLNESAVVQGDLAPVGPGKLSAATSYALSPGAGIELILNDRLSVRVFQLDYLVTHYWNVRQDNARVSAGISFNFGQTTH